MIGSVRVMELISPFQRPYVSKVYDDQDWLPEIGVYEPVKEAVVEFDWDGFYND